MESAKMGGELGPGLGRIRRRRWYVWGLVAAYLPTMLIAIGATSSLAAGGVAFAVWFLLLSTAVMAAALARCPRCGNRFHLDGMTLLPTRRCLHCQLPIRGDRGKKSA
ncbi:MAG: hypothetical protein IH614_11955 [Desulfuromonadales bacterium]|nr:hypothetical protein [Desulfuromonadales bacterium]